MGSETSILSKDDVIKNNAAYQLEQEKEREREIYYKQKAKQQRCEFMKKKFIQEFNEEAIKDPGNVRVSKYYWTTIPDCGEISTESLMVNNQWKRLPDSYKDKIYDDYALYDVECVTYKIIL
jgi:hypothetical protein